MKKQTYISKLEDGDYKTIDFERWTQKRLGDVRNALLDLYTGVWSSLYKKDLEQASYITIYATPEQPDNYILKERYTVKDFLSLAN